MSTSTSTTTTTIYLLLTIGIIRTWIIFYSWIKETKKGAYTCRCIFYGRGGGGRVNEIVNLPERSVHLKFSTPIARTTCPGQKAVAATAGLVVEPVPRSSRRLEVSRRVNEPRHRTFETRSLPPDARITYFLPRTPFLFSVPPIFFSFVPFRGLFRLLRKH